MRALVWLRLDLRARDNRALEEAARRATKGVIAVYLLAPKMWREHDECPDKVSFWLRCVRELSETLESRNIPLLIREAAGAGDAAGALLSICDEHDCDAVFYNRQYEVNETQRDEDVEERCGRRKVEVFAFHDQTAVEPGAVRTKGDGAFYTVFTPFKRAWLDVYKSGEGAEIAGLPKRQPEMPCKPDDVPEGIDDFEPRVEADLWPAGEDHARRRLKRFVEERIGEYASKRDIPAADGTSTLSPYLACGAVSVRQCLQAAIEANDGRIDSGRKGVSTWISELIWREFYRHVLVGFPRVSMGRAFDIETDGAVEWQNDETGFAAWKDGKTGYPIVDAAMRSLRETAWMHNRLRMVAAMFLTKHLLIDWRWGERWFMERLIDGDLASNNGGWQWSASVGTDAAPYFRIFNPFSQSKRFDSDGAFIRRHLPELADVDAASLHDPDRLSDLERSRVDYPSPIIDHRKARERALSAFKRA